MKYDLKIYLDYYGVFEKINVFEDTKFDFTLEEKKKIIDQLKKQGAIQHWHGSFYKLATPYNVFFPDCECYLYKEDDDDVDYCDCEHLVDLGKEWVTLRQYENYDKSRLINDWGILPVLVSECGELGLPTKEEIFCVDLGDHKIDFSGYKGFSFYADTPLNDCSISLMQESGFFESMGYSKDLWNVCKKEAVRLQAMES